MSTAPSSPAGVGIIGAGVVTQAIHIPTISRLPELLRVRYVADIDAIAANVVAARAGAIGTTDLEQMLADPDVQIVVVGSPHRFHAQQIVAACEAGKRVILCEKPLATTRGELADIESALARHGSQVVVGAMLAYDPAWRAAAKVWMERGERADYARSTIYLPSNSVMIDLATDLLPAPAGRPIDLGTAQGRIEMLSNGVLGLATHALPQIRTAMPTLDRVLDARLLHPWGYAITLSDGARTAQMFALMPGQWGPAWTFEAWSQDAVLSLTSPPAFVHARSSTATIADGRATTSWSAAYNGYESEWIHLAALAGGDLSDVLDIKTSIADLELGLAIIDKAREAEGLT